MFSCEVILESQTYSIEGLGALDGELIYLPRGHAAEARWAGAPRALRIYLNSLSIA